MFQFHVDQRWALYLHDIVTRWIYSRPEDAGGMDRIFTLMSQGATLYSLEECKRPAFNKSKLYKI